MQTQQVVEPTIIDPEAVAAFYRRRPGTEAVVRQTVKIVQEEFSNVESLTLQADRDPEEDSEWIRVTVTARLKSDDLQAAYRRYVSRSIAQQSSDLWHYVRLLRFRV